jgi:hypothetical protein
VTRQLVRRTQHGLRPNPTRTVTTLFRPGQEGMTPGTSRATHVLDRVLRLSEDQVERTLESMIASFGSRHQGIARALDSRFELIAHRVDNPDAVSLARRRLIGASFSQEYAVESAALFNPSILALPDQSGLSAGTLLLRHERASRGRGSHIQHRMAHGYPRRERPPGPRRTCSPPGPGPTHTDPVLRGAILRQLAESAEDDIASARYVLDRLAESFDRSQLDVAMAALAGQDLTRGPSCPALDQLEQLAAAQYTIRFPEGSSLDQRVIMPGGAAEARGLEDLRLVHLTELDGSTSYRGTYPAFDETHVTPALLRTVDLLTFDSQQPTGVAAHNKGMALFPRPVAGRYLALSRWDRESTSLAESADLAHWDLVCTLQQPTQPWEVVQVDSCESPAWPSLGRRPFLQAGRMTAELQIEENLRSGLWSRRQSSTCRTWARRKVVESE